MFKEIIEKSKKEEDPITFMRKEVLKLYVEDCKDCAFNLLKEYSDFISELDKINRSGSHVKITSSRVNKFMLFLYNICYSNTVLYEKDNNDNWLYTKNGNADDLIGVIGKRLEEVKGVVFSELMIGQKKCDEEIWDLIHSLANLVMAENDFLGPKMLIEEGLLEVKDGLSYRWMEELLKLMQVANKGSGIKIPQNDMVKILLKIGIDHVNDSVVNKLLEHYGNVESNGNQLMYECMAIGNEDMIRKIIPFLKSFKVGASKENASDVATRFGFGGGLINLLKTAQESLELKQGLECVAENKSIRSL